MHVGFGRGRSETCWRLASKAPSAHLIAPAIDENELLWKHLTRASHASALRKECAVAFRAYLHEIASRSLRVSGRRVRSAATFVRQPDNNLPRYVGLPRFSGQLVFSSCPGLGLFVLRWREVVECRVSAS